MADTVSIGHVCDEQFKMASVQAMRMSTWGNDHTSNAVHEGWLRKKIVSINTLINHQEQKCFNKPLAEKYGDWWACLVHEGIPNKNRQTSVVYLKRCWWHCVTSREAELNFVRCESLAGFLIATFQPKWGCIKRKRTSVLLLVFCWHLWTECERHVTKKALMH